MKVIAIEKDLSTRAAADRAALLLAEAKAAWDLCQFGTIREVYFRDVESRAVLVLEVSSTREAEAVLAQLPLVRAGLSEFELIGLRPYPGFARLFAR